MWLPQDHVPGVQRRLERRLLLLLRVRVLGQVRHLKRLGLREVLNELAAVQFHGVRVLVNRVFPSQKQCVELARAPEYALLRFGIVEWWEFEAQRDRWYIFWREWWLREALELMRSKRPPSDRVASKATIFAATDEWPFLIVD